MNSLPKIIAFVVVIFSSVLFFSQNTLATLVNTTISAEISWISGNPVGLESGDSVVFEFLYDDGDISHDPFSQGSMDLFRSYQSEAEVTVDSILGEWVNMTLGENLQEAEIGTYELYEPDGTELNEFFEMSNSFFYMSSYHTLNGGGFEEMYFSLNGYSGTFLANNLSVSTEVVPLQEAPEPTSILLFLTGLLVLVKLRGKESSSINWMDEWRFKTASIDVV